MISNKYIFFNLLCTFRFGTWHSIKSEFQTDQVFEGSALVTNVDERHRPTSRDDEGQGPFLTISQSSSVHKAEMVDGTVETRSESK